MHCKSYGTFVQFIPKLYRMLSSYFLTAGIIQFTKYIYNNVFNVYTAHGLVDFYTLKPEREYFFAKSNGNTDTTGMAMTSEAI